MPATLADIKKKYGEDVYPLYKDELCEPYMDNPIGEGYMGVVLYDESEDKVQCAECGKWFKKITTSHIKKHGFKTIRDYKDKHEILYGAALQGLETSRIQSAKALENKNFLKWMGRKDSKHLRKAQSVRKQRASSRKAHRKVAYKNLKATCDAQIVKRLKVVAGIVGRSVRDNDLRKYDYALSKILEYRFGNANKGIEHYGIKPPTTKGEFKITDPQLIGELRLFVMKYGFIPPANEFTKYGLHKRDTYIDRFGSWRRAKMMAGLDQLLAEAK